MASAPPTLVRSAGVARWSGGRGGEEERAPRPRGRRWSAVAAQLPGGGRPVGAGGARRPSQTFFLLVAGPGSLVLRDHGPSRGVRGPPGSVPAASRSRPSQPGCGPRGSRQTQPRVRTRIRGDGSPPPLRASPRATQSGTVLTARVGGQAGDKLSRRPWPWALRPPHAPRTPCPAASRPNLRPDRAVRGHSVRGHRSVPVPLLPPRSPRGHGGAPFRPRGRSRQDAPHSPAGRTPRPRPGPHAAARTSQALGGRGFAPWEPAAAVLTARCETEEAASQGRPLLGRAPRPTGPQWQSRAPLRAGRPALCCGIRAATCRSAPAFPDDPRWPVEQSRPQGDGRRLLMAPAGPRAPAPDEALLGEARPPAGLRGL